jgi:DNA polymerase/3'-5' exonuclease PolX
MNMILHNNFRFRRFDIMKRLILILSITGLSLTVFAQSNVEATASKNQKQEELKKIGLELSPTQLKQMNDINSKFFSKMNQIRQSGDLEKLSAVQQEMNKELKAVLTKEQIKAMIKLNNPEKPDQKRSPE